MKTNSIRGKCILKQFLLPQLAWHKHSKFCFPNWSLEFLKQKLSIKSGTVKSKQFLGPLLKNLSQKNLPISKPLLPTKQLTHRVIV